MSQPDVVASLWPQVITAVAAVAAGALSGFFVWLASIQTFREQRKVAVEQRKTERLEELYVLFELWMDDLFSAYVNAVQRHRGVLTPEEEVNALAKRNSQSKSDFNRLQMIVDLHLPELKEPLEKVLEGRNKCSKILLTKMPGNLKEFFEDQREFEASCKAFKNAMTDLSALRSR